MNKNVGKNIANYRKLKGVSQKYLADKIGISPQGLYKIEKGIASPRAVTLEKIMFALSITPNQIFGIERITEDNSNVIEELQEIRA